MFPPWRASCYHIIPYFYLAFILLSYFIDFWQSLCLCLTDKSEFYGWLLNLLASKLKEKGLGWEFWDNLVFFSRTNVVTSLEPSCEGDLPYKCMYEKINLGQSSKEVKCTIIILHNFYPFPIKCSTLELPQNEEVLIKSHVFM